MPDAARILVAAPNEQVFERFKELYPPIEGTRYKLVENFRDITSNWGPIIILNGGSWDAHIRNLCNHPSRQGIITRLEV